MLHFRVGGNSCIVMCWQGRQDLNPHRAFAHGFGDRCIAIMLHPCNRNEVWWLASVTIRPLGLFRPPLIHLSYPAMWLLCGAQHAGLYVSGSGPVCKTPRCKSASHCHVPIYTIKKAGDHLRLCRHYRSHFRQLSLVYSYQLLLA